MNDGVELLRHLSLQWDAIKDFTLRIRKWSILTSKRGTKLINDQRDLNISKYSKFDNPFTIYLIFSKEVDFVYPNWRSDNSIFGGLLKIFQSQCLLRLHYPGHILIVLFWMTHIIKISFQKERVIDKRRLAITMGTFV